MYNAFFGFKESPFSLSPDPAFFYRSEQHEEALANLVYGVQARKGFIVLTGEVGTGKTTMLECLRDHLEAQYIEFAFIFNSRITSDQFFEMIAYDLNLSCSRASKTEVLFALNQLLVEQAQDGRTVVLIVDEAHNLEWDVLEEIRLLGNLENRNGKLLQIVLAGQPEFDRKLDAPNLRQLKQRIVLRYSLQPFTLRDAVEYMQSRLERAGMLNQTVFPEELMSEIHLRTQGIPRVINAICDNLLLTAFALEQKVCTVEMLDEVCRDIRRILRADALLTRQPPGSGSVCLRRRAQAGNHRAQRIQARGGGAVLHENLHHRARRRPHVPESVWRAAFDVERLPKRRVHRLVGPDGELERPRQWNEQVKLNIVVLMHGPNSASLDLDARGANVGAFPQSDRSVTLIGFLAVIGRDSHDNPDVVLFFMRAILQFDSAQFDSTQGRQLCRQECSSRFCSFQR